MVERTQHFNNDRRTFLKRSAALGGAAMLAGYASNAGHYVARAAQMSSTGNWAKQMGLQIGSNRDLLAKDFVGTLEKVTAIGYKEVETAEGYANMEPKAFRAVLDRLGLNMPSTHTGATEGPDLEKQLEGFQIMGLKYTMISAPATGRGGRGGGRGPIIGFPPGSGRGGPGQGAGPPATPDSVKRTAAEANEHGKIAKKFGMKIQIHNHAQEFQPFEGSSLMPYDILLAETDPDLVAMQLDIGWAIVAGQDVLGMFKKNPGRYELWHVKDVLNTTRMDPKLSQRERMQVAYVVPVGLGDIDYKPFFANAELAGLKHFYVEQETAPDWGDSMAASRTSYENLVKLLS